jgi:hypothetical protein
MGTSEFKNLISLIIGLLQEKFIPLMPKPVTEIKPITTPVGAESSVSAGAVENIKPEEPIKYAEKEIEEIREVREYQVVGKYGMVNIDIAPNFVKPLPIE